MAFRASSLIFSIKVGSQQVAQFYSFIKSSIENAHRDNGFDTNALIKWIPQLLLLDPHTNMPAAKQ